VEAPLLQRLLADPDFDLAPPKSTGRDLFNADWLQAALDDAGAGVSAPDVQATLAELTVSAATQALRRHAPHCSRLLVCGGGAFNAHLMRRLAAQLPGLSVQSSAAVGVPPDQVEALAFAWLAMRFVERRAGNLPEVTGARGPRVLGALYPA
jgi:anhydro-N-acetylmuramic acid kinase